MQSTIRSREAKDAKLMRGVVVIHDITTRAVMEGEALGEADEFLEKDRKDFRVKSKIRKMKRFLDRKILHKLCTITPQSSTEPARCTMYI